MDIVTRKSKAQVQQADYEEAKVTLEPLDKLLAAIDHLKFNESNDKMQSILIKRCNGNKNAP